MTRVDFYVLGGQSRDDQWLFACRLIEKAARQGNQILVQVDNQAAATEFDQLLWTFRPDAFVPHAIFGQAGDTDGQNCQVNIGWHDDPFHQHDVLINLSEKLPDFFSRFHRLIEVVVQQDDVLNYTRSHYKFMKDRGYPITHTDMRMR